MNYCIGAYKNKYKVRKFSLIDFSVLLLIIGNNSFPDFRQFRLISQIFALVLVLINSILINRTVPWYSMWGGLYISYNLLSGLWAPEYSSTLVSMSISIIQVIVIGLIIILYCTNKEKTENVIFFFFLSGLIITIRFFIEIPVSWWGQGFRFGSETIFGSNRTAMILTFTSILIIPNIKVKKFFLIPIILFSLITFLMGTKMGLIGLFVGIGSYYLSNKKVRLKQVFLLFGLLIIITLLIFKIEFFYNSIGYRFEGLFSLLLEGEGDSSSNARLYLMKEALDVFLSHPVLGTGLDGFRYNLTRMTYSHSNYLELLANGGLIGFIIYYYLPLLLLVKTFYFSRNECAETRIFFAVIMTILVNDIFNVTYFREYVFILFALIYSRVIEKN